MIIAVAMSQKAKLVSHGRSLKQCRGIVNKCGLKAPPVLSLSEFETEIIFS